MRSLPRNRRLCLYTLALLAVLAFLPGCKWTWGWFGNNVTFNVRLPLGLDGTIGLLNPDGGTIGQGTGNGTTDDDNGTVIPPDIL